MAGRRIFGSDLELICELCEVSGGESDGQITSGGEAMVPETLDEAVEEEARQPRLPHNPGRPTKKEILEHCVSHWPFRSWCRHCVCGRAVGIPYKVQSEADREFGRERIPTISMDHCY